MDKTMCGRSKIKHTRAVSLGQMMITLSEGIKSYLSPNPHI